MARIRRGADYHGEARGLRKDGSVFDVEVYGAPLTIDGQACHFSSLIDVTERNRLRRRVEQSQRMEALGRLAGGISHDFNNLLTVIMGNADLARMVDDPDEREEALEQVCTAAERARELTRQLLAFGRKQPLFTQGVALNETLERSQTMLQRLIRHDIAIHYSLEPDLPRVLVDVSQLDQVILNLVLNGRDAMPRGGVLTIATSSRNMSEQAAEALELSDGSYVSLTVTDTGLGMDPATQSRIFEPFFTTKPVGEGTGLGLATVYGIVKQHGGHVAVTSHPGRGTRFEVLFPATEADEATPPSRTHEAPRFAGERVLVVDDSEQVRRLAARWLRQAGCEVLMAESPTAAAQLARQTPIDVLLTDVVMPGKNGKELFDDLRLNNAALRVVYMSGYSHEILNEGRFLDKKLSFVAKPFDYTELMNAVRAAADRGEVAAVTPRGGA